LSITEAHGFVIACKHGLFGPYNVNSGIIDAIKINGLASSPWGARCSSFLYEGLTPSFHYQKFHSPLRRLWASCRLWPMPPAVHRHFSRNIDTGLAGAVLKQDILLGDFISHPASLFET
jgi:hypothetical protein